MPTKEYIASRAIAKKLDIHLSKFYKLKAKIVKDVNEFKEKHPGITTYTLQQFQGPEQIVDEMALFAAWIDDRLNGYRGYPSGDKTYRKSLGKKIRKALGFNL